MNLTKAEKVRLGVFLLSGTGLIVGSLLVLAGFKIWETKDHYRVRYHDSVSGLEISAQVKYQGLRVGRVDDIYVAPDDPNAIEVVLAVDPKVVLYEGTLAALDTGALTGLKTVNLVPGDVRKTKIKQGSLIPPKASLFDTITDQAEQITARIERITEQVARWTSDRNRRRVELLVDSTSSLAVGLNEFLGETRGPIRDTLIEIGKTSESVRGTTDEATVLLRRTGDDISSTLSEVQRTMVQARKIIDAVNPKDVNLLVRSSAGAMKNLEGRLAPEEMGAAVIQLQKTLVEVNKLLGEMDLAVRASREDFVESLKHVRQATEDIREFSRMIAQDPSVLVRGTETSE